MTPHVHHPAGPDAEVRPGAPAARASGGARAARPRWLLPALAVGIVAAALVMAGVLPLSTVLYAGLFGGMIFMHLGGHGGHGGHGASGGMGGHDGHGDEAQAGREDLRRPSAASQQHGSGSGEGLDDRAPNDPNGDRTDDHDQHNSHACN